MNKFTKNKAVVTNGFIFLSQSRKIIYTFILLGFLSSTMLLYFSPSEYEAIGSIKVAKMIDVKTLRAVNFEDANQVVEKFYSPESPFYKNNDVCKKNISGVQYIFGATQHPVVRVYPQRGRNGIIDLKVTSSNSEAAFQCASRVFDVIRAIQSDSIELVRDQLIARSSLLASTLNIKEFRGDIALDLRMDIHSQLHFIKSNAPEASLIDGIKIVDASLTGHKARIIFSGLFLGFLVGIFTAIVAKLTSKKY
jgi:hypothetical protein